MERKPTPISHESFPEFIARLETNGVKLNARGIRRALASFFNLLIGCALAFLTVCALFSTIEPGKISPEEAFSHIPDFFTKAGKWTLGLFPETLNIWICIAILLCAIPVTGFVTGLLFRWIPLKGKAVKVSGETPMEKTENAIAVADQLRTKYNSVTDYFNFSIYVSPIVGALTVLALPIISVCRAGVSSEWYIVIAAVIIMLLKLFFLLAITLFVLVMALFWLSVAQEWCTGILYTGHRFYADREQLSEYKKLLEQEAVDTHKKAVADTEAQAIAMLVSGDVSGAQKVFAPIEKEAAEAEVFHRIVRLTVKKQDMTTQVEWLLEKAEDIKSQTLRTYVEQRQTACKEALLIVAEESYPKALALLEEEKYIQAIPHLLAAKAVDYRDSVALYALADYKTDLTPSKYKRTESALHDGLQKGVESDTLRILCQKALEQIQYLISEEQRQRYLERERKKAEQRAEEAYWLEVGRQINMTCQYKQGDYCCRYCTIDNFPHKCYYLDRPRDMWMCTDRKS